MTRADVVWALVLTVIATVAWLAAGDIRTRVTGRHRTR